jgi:hypothetical protein
MQFKARYAGKAALIVVGVAVAGGLVMTLWNAVMPDVFAGIRPIDYWHALGLMLLSRILFVGGLRGRGGMGHHPGWRKWQAMTQEEREQFRQDRMSWWSGRKGE